MPLKPHFVGVPPLLDSYELDLREDEIKLEVPGYRQVDGYSCGPVAAWSVLQTFNPSLSFRKFYQDCKVTEDGTNEYQIIRALRKNGVGVSLRDEMEFDDVAKAIDDGFPILTSISLGGNIDHWVCIYGVGLNPQRLFTCNHGGASEHHGRMGHAWEVWLRIWDDSSRYLICWGKL